MQVEVESESGESVGVRLDDSDDEEDESESDESDEFDGSDGSGSD